MWRVAAESVEVIVNLRRQSNRRCADDEALEVGVDELRARLYSQRLEQVRVHQCGRKQR